MSNKKIYNNKNIELGKILGTGSFGNVYSAKLKSTGELIAIKRVNKKKMNLYGEYLINAFFKELECMEKCNCENSVKYYTNFETDNNYNIVMELCDNDLSHELYKRPQGFTLKEVKYIMSQLNNAFKKLSENNIIHRDLKLGNILIKYTDETKTNFIPKLCDYGFSKELKKAVTRTHLGTPATMAPEIINNKPYNSKADLWSVGVLIYQLHFNSLPYDGVNEKEIYEKIKNRVPIKQSGDKIFDDLINKLLVEDPDKRLSWDEYFNHLFFKSDYKNNIIIEKNNNLDDKNISLNQKENVIYIGNDKRFKYESDFDVGFKSDVYKCRIAEDLKKKKLVLIKTYSEEFILSHAFYFKMEFYLSKIFSKNKNFLQLYKVENEKNIGTHFIFEFIDCEILSSYLTHHDFTEEEIKIFNKELLNNVFNFCESNFKSFIFISPYSFAITKNNKYILFDYGLHKFFISPEEYQEYYTPNKDEINLSDNPIKTNVMNYGITLLKIFFGNNLKINILNNDMILPEGKNMSNNFKKFVGKCLKKNIEKRSSWLDLKKDDFTIDDINKKNELNVIDNNNSNFFISDKKMNGILKSLDIKYDMINKYYETIEINEKDNFFEQHVLFLILTLIEELIILELFKNKEKLNLIQYEISFLTIFKKKIDHLKINFRNPIFDTISIFNINNPRTENFILKLKSHINKSKNLSLKLKNSDLFSGDYQNFLKLIFNSINNPKYEDFFYFLVQEANKDWLQRKYLTSKLKAAMGEYLCENLFFKIMNINDIENGEVYFNIKDLKTKLDAIFENEDENNLDISSIKFVKEKDKYIFVSFLGIFFKKYIYKMHFDKNMIINNNKALKNLLEFYPKMMKIFIETK